MTVTLALILVIVAIVLFLIAAPGLALWALSTIVGNVLK